MTVPNIARSAEYWFNRSLSCSEAMFTVLNRGAGLTREAEEQAAHPLAGGILRQGHACGMLWGSALAAGVRAPAQFPDPALAGAAALFATGRVLEEFRAEVGAVNCREIIAGGLETMAGRVSYLTSGKPVACRKLAVAFAPRAHAALDRALQEFQPESLKQAPRTCTQEFWRRARGGAGEREGVMVAGLAGGLGLSGNACGVLAAGMWALGLDFYQRQPAPRDSFWKALLQEVGVGTELLRRCAALRHAFRDRHGSDLCAAIMAGRFADADDHSRFVAEGGCRVVIEGMVEELREGTQMGY